MYQVYWGRLDSVDYWAEFLKWALWNRMARGIFGICFWSDSLLGQDRRSSLGSSGWCWRGERRWFCVILLCDVEVQEGVITPVVQKEGETGWNKKGFADARVLRPKNNFSLSKLRADYV